MKAGALELEAPLLEMVALLLESKLCPIWTEGLWKVGPKVLALELRELKGL